MFGGRIYLAGGLTRNRIETYDPNTGQFALLHMTLHKTGACSIVPYENQIYIFQSGGVIQTLDMETNEIRVVKDNDDWKHWWSHSTAVVF